MRFRELESLRGVAALMVAWYHSAFISGDRPAILENAALFVDFFFVLSGFVMAHAYGSRIAEGLKFGDFLILRLGRLWPLHIVALSLWIPLVLVRLSLGETPGFITAHQPTSFLVNATLLNSIGLTPYLSWNYPSWSIGAEMVAYIAFFAAAATGRLSLARAMLLSACAYGAMLALGAHTFQRHFDLGALRAIGGFFLGVAAFALFRTPSNTRLTGALEIVVVAAAALLLTRAPGSLLNELATFAVFALAVLVFAAGAGPISRLLRQPAVIWLGTVSYSVYMLHALVFQTVRLVATQYGDLPKLMVLSPVDMPRQFLITPQAWLINLGALAVTLALATLAYRWIERPARAWTRDLVERRAATRPAAA